MSLTHASLVCLSRTPVLGLRGADVADLLQRISTNDMTPLTKGKDVVTIFTTEKGKIAEVAHVVPRQEHHSYYLVLFGAYEDDFAEWLSRYIIMEDVRIDDAPIASSHCILYQDGFERSLVTPEIREKLARNRFVVVDERYRGNMWARIIDCDGDERSTRFLRDLLNVPIATYDAYDMARIAAGIPAAGKELSPSFNPLEALMREYISFTKGCYVGQEVIARLDSYRKISRVLVRVRGTGRPGEGPLSSGGSEAGILTSVQPNAGNEWSGLGFIKEPAVRATDLRVEASGARVQVLDPDPFGQVYGEKHG